MPRFRDAKFVKMDGADALRLMVNGTQIWPVTAEVAGPYDALYAKDWKPVTGTTAIGTPLNVPLPPKYTSINTPSTRDPSFHTALFRATDRADLPSGVQGTSRYRHEYSRRCPFNCDNTLYMVMNGGADFWVHRVSDGARIPGGRTDGSVGNATARPKEPCDWIWHPTDPNKIIFKPQGKSFKFYLFDVITHTMTLHRDLETRVKALYPTADGLSKGGEGRPSDNGRWWGFKVGVMDSAGRSNLDTPLALLTYDMDSDVIVAHIPTNTNPNNVTMSSLGNFIIASNHHSETEQISKADCDASSNLNYLGTQCWKRDFSARRTMHISSEHADVGIDATGREIYIFSNYYATTLAGVDSGWVHMRDCETGTATRLVQNWGTTTQTNQHVSACNTPGRPGWFVWSVYDDDDRGETSYKDGTVCLVQLKANPKVIRVAHHRVVRTTYWHEPHATISRNGLLVMFSSTWNDGPLDTTPNTVPLSYFAALPSWVYD